MHNSGKEYEQFVADLQQALLDSEKFVAQKNIKIELNKKIEDNCGNEREFDLYWEYELGGIAYKTVIECKDYNSNISVEKIDALIGKIKDIPDLKAVFATKKGYQRGAQKKAQQNRIDLLIVRKQNDKDWEDAEGNPYLKKIHINMELKLPAVITKFEPHIDGNWVQKNTEIDTSKPIEFSDLNNAIFIDDLDTNKKYSIHELESNLPRSHNDDFGKFTKEEKFNNAFFCYGEMKLKLHSYKVEYLIRKPLQQPMLIDFSKELIGVIEYLYKGIKKTIFKEGVIREEKL